jgi:hypothetical protein
LPMMLSLRTHAAVSPLHASAHMPCGLPAI